MRSKTRRRPTRIPIASRLKLLLSSALALSRSKASTKNCRRHRPKIRTSLLSLQVFDWPCWREKLKIDYVVLLTLDRLVQLENDSKASRGERSPASDVEYLKDQISVLTVQLKEYIHLCFPTITHNTLNLWLWSVRMEKSRDELMEERQKWQLSSLALSCENRDSGVASGINSPRDSLLSASDHEVKDSDFRELKYASDEVPMGDAIAQVIHLWSLPMSPCSTVDFERLQLMEARKELETLRLRFDTVQSEKKELEDEFLQLKDNYSLLSSQSKTVRFFLDALCFSFPFFFIFFYLVSWFVYFLYLWIAFFRSS